MSPPTQKNGGKYECHKVIIRSVINSASGLTYCVINRSPGLDHCYELITWS